MRLTIIVGALLILIGLTAYATAETTSLTALFPAALGIVLLTLGFAAVAPKFRRDAVHIAVLIATIGIAAFLPNAIDLPRLISGGTVERPQAVAVSALTVVVLITYLVFSVRSFRRARRARQQTPPEHA